jgi:hypothetical protein
MALINGDDTPSDEVQGDDGLDFDALEVHLVALMVAEGEISRIWILDLLCLF